MQNVIIYQIEKDLTDAEFIEVIRKFWPIVSTKNRGVYSSIFGYDEDPRELWQIPEVKILCERLVNLGFISILEPTTLFTEEKGFDAFFGALEIWALSKGLFTFQGDLEMTPELFNEFKVVLSQSNMKVLKWVSTVKEGQNRI